MDEPGFEPGSFGTEVWNARQWPNYWTNRLLDELGFEPGSFGTEVWNARQWPNLFYIKMYKFGDLNLNNSKIGGLLENQNYQQFLLLETVHPI